MLLNYMLFRSRPPDNVLSLTINNQTPAGMYTLYCPLFHPYLSYCNEIWGNTYPSNVKCFFTLQKKAIMLISNAHTNAMFKDMSILKLSEFVKYKTAIVMFNLFHGILPIQLQRRFTKYLSIHSTLKKNHL